MNILRTSLYGAASGLMLAAIAGTGVAAAEDDFISGSAGVSYNSHFISYGADVWGGGDDFFGNQSTTFAWTDLGIAIDDLTVNVGIWADINNNISDSLGGNIQEIDWYIGGTYNFGPVSAGLMYQEWNYGADEEKIIDLTLALNDAEWWGGDFALSPKIVWHFRVDGNGPQEEGSAIVVSIAPTFALDESLTLTIPAGIAFFMDEGFQLASTDLGYVYGDDGYAYSYIGASLGVPLTFIPESYGAWSVNLDVTGYFTDEDAIPGNPEENFIVGAVGIKVAY